MAYEMRISDWSSDVCSSDLREAPSGMAAIVNIVPSNVIAAVADNDILAVMFFALMFGIGLVLVRSPAGAQLKTMIEGLFEVSLMLLGLVIRLSPLAVACFMFTLASLFGWALLGRLWASIRQS